MQVEDVSTALRVQLGRNATEGLLTLFEATRQEWAAEVTSVALARFDERLTTECATLRCEVLEAIRQTAASTRDADRESGATLRREMSALRGDVIKWSLLMCAVQAATTAVIVASMVALAGR